MTALRSGDCARCVFRAIDDPFLELDVRGVCRHCRQYESRRRNERPLADREKEFESLVVEMKERGRGKPYDCVLGLSGGVDSSYVALLAHRHRLRALVVHLDNGWDTEASISNIENALRTGGFDLHTYVIDWPEFRDLQISYLKAGVIDIEALTDHAIFAALVQAARKFDVRYVLNGTSWATEGFLPETWVHMKSDSWNIRSIHRRFGTLPLRTFPLMSPIGHWFSERFLGIRNVAVLDLVDYRKAEAKRRLIDEFGWRDYGGKHHESVFTRFYQTYILPTKFGVDKRRSHYSTLICAGQMTRHEAIEELAKPPVDPKLAAIDKVFVARKFGVSPEEFDGWMAAPRRSHLEFGSYRKLMLRLSSLKRRMLGRPPMVHAS